MKERPGQSSLHPCSPLHCLKDRDEETPTTAQLCKRLEQLKATQAYTASEENTRASIEKKIRLKEEEKVAEIIWLEEQMRQLYSQ